jgi:TolA-binding protein
MTSVGRRKLRVLFKIGLIVCLPLTGYLWAQSGVSTAAIAMSVVCMVMALGAEGFASAAEAELSQIRAQSDLEERNFQAQATNKEEKIRQMDRIVETLSNQNHDLRSKLVSIHGEIHRTKGEPSRHAVPDPSAVRVAESEQPSEETPGSTGAAVTDLASLRFRR